MSYFRNITSFALFVILGAVPDLAQVTLGINTEWDKVSDADLKAVSPAVDKDAGLEAIFWRVHVVDERQGDSIQRALFHYVRLKVFNEKGKEAASTIDIPYAEKTTILYISARTIKPDGTIVEMKKDGIRDREVFRAGRFRRKVKTLAIPGVEPGVVVEYRWKEARSYDNLYYLRLQLSREYPVREVTYFVKPLQLAYDLGYKMFSYPFNCKPSELKLEHNGFHSTSLRNVPAFEEEPMMPAEANLRPWILLFYSDKPKRDINTYWTDVGRDSYKELKQAIRLGDSVKQAATSAVEGASDNDAKVRALIRYIRKNVQNVLDSSVSDTDRTKWFKSVPKNRLRNSEEILELKVATPAEMNTLFAAMAQHVGLDARPVLVASRDDISFYPELVERYFLDTVVMGVKEGETWRLYDVSNRLLEPTMLDWTEEGVHALISDPKKAAFVQTPVSPPEASAVVRNAKFKLDAEGTLSGTVQERYTGHKAHDQRKLFAGDSESRAKERVEEVLKTVFSTSEVSDAKVENTEDPEKPLVIKYSVKIPGYAGRTGKRLFLQPMFFQRGEAPMFEAAKRTHNLVFNYAWTESDEVAVEFPEDFRLEKPESPGSLNFGQPGSYNSLYRVRNDRELLVSRKFTFGAKSMLVFSKDMYPTLKRVFDEIHRLDGHSIALKEGQ
ncbi:MAG TPA: DUF3857 and transglutaminase domain-containing protein [Bryobacteraceae bacterium]|nr:DUF3857 and transglutaminase domain-containing protein [Bryobacteraceae bacterium]